MTFLDLKLSPKSFHLNKMLKQMKERKTGRQNLSVK
jgi:hypothetical protein